MTTVLVVEDEPDLREIARFHLEAGGYTVVEAGDAEAAMEQAVAVPPDLVLLDLRLPGTDGWAVLHALRERTRPDIPVVVLSAHGSGPNIERAVELGCRGYVRKPFTARQLLDAVAAALDPGMAPVTD